jgi:hypothetical protein
MSAMRQCRVWHGWRWIGLTCILLLIIAAVAIREAEHASQVQHMARHLFASVSPSHHLKVSFDLSTTCYLPAHPGEDPSQWLNTSHAQRRLGKGNQCSPLSHGRACQRCVARHAWAGRQRRSSCGCSCMPCMCAKSRCADFPLLCRPVLSYPVGHAAPLCRSHRGEADLRAALSPWLTLTPLIISGRMHSSHRN